MDGRLGDGSAGDANYGAIGPRYSQYRQPEPAIMAIIDASLGDAGTVLNVGAGAGSYEPQDRLVTAIEPSATMRAQRPPRLTRAIDGTAETLDFPDGTFDAAMTTFSVHQWNDLAAGLRNMRRVTRGPVLVLTCDPLLVEAFWLNDYAPQVLATEARRYPSLAAIGAALGGSIEILPVGIPLDCRDGFNEAYYGRPERLLEPGARTACSAWSFVDPATAAGYVDGLAADLASGGWDAKHGDLRTRPSYEGSLRLVIGRP